MGDVGALVREGGVPLHRLRLGLERLRQCRDFISTARVTDNIVRLGINYRFYPDGPVVARY